MSVINCRTGGALALNNLNGGNLYVMKNVVDFAVDVAAENDVVQLFDVPEKHLVVGVKACVLTAEGAARTMDVGSFSAAGQLVDVDCWLDGANINSTATDTMSIPGALGEGAPNTITPAYALGQYYPDGGIIAATMLGGAVDGAKVVFHMLCVPLTD